MSEPQMAKDEGFGKLLAAGHSLWLAGLGAMAEVEEGGRGLFDRLVERGRPVEESQRQVVAAVAGGATRTAQAFGKLLRDTMEYESRGILRRFNVMTLDDVKVLSARLEALSKTIDEYAARRQAALVEAVEPVAPAVATPKPRTAAARPKAPRPRPTKTTR